MASLRKKYEEPTRISASHNFEDMEKLSPRWKEERKLSRLWKKAEKGETKKAGPKKKRGRLKIARKYTDETSKNSEPDMDDWTKESDIDEDS